MLPIVDFSGTIIKLLPIPYDSCRIGMSAKAEQYRSFGTTETGLEPSARAAAAAMARVAKPSAKGRSRGSHGCLGGVYCFFLSALLDFHHFGSRSGGAVFDLLRSLRRTYTSLSNMRPAAGESSRASSAPVWAVPLDASNSTSDSIFRY